MLEQVNTTELDEPIIIDLAFNGGKLSFENFVAFQEWIDDEYQTWKMIFDSINNRVDVDSFNLTYMNEKINEGLELLNILRQNNFNINDDLASSSLSIKNKLANSPFNIQTNKNDLIELYGRGDFISKRSEIFEKYKGHFTSINSHTINDLAITIGLLAGFLNVTVTITTNNDKIIANCSQSKKIGNEFRIKQIEEFLARNTSYKVIKKVEKYLYDQTEESINKISNLEKELTSAAGKAINQIDTYATSNKTLIASKEAVDGWKNKSKVFMVKQISSALFMITSVIIISTLYGIALFEFMRLIKYINDFTNNHPELVLIPLTAVFAIAMFIFLKIFSNSFSEYQHLANDADQRVAIFNTYRLLAEDPKLITDSATEIMLKEVLTRTTPSQNTKIKHPIEEILDEKNLRRLVDAIVKIKTSGTP